MINVTPASQSRLYTVVLTLPVPLLMAEPLGGL